MTGTHRHFDWRPRRPISLSLTSETDLSGTFIQPQRVWGKKGESGLNNRCETTCTSLRRLLVDNAATRRRGGRGRGRTGRPVQQTICNHTNLPVDLLGRPVGGQATAHDRGRPSVKCELK